MLKWGVFFGPFFRTRFFLKKNVKNGRGPSHTTVRSRPLSNTPSPPHTPPLYPSGHSINLEVPRGTFRNFYKFKKLVNSFRPFLRGVDDLQEQHYVLHFPELSPLALSLKGTLLHNLSVLKALSETLPPGLPLKGTPSMNLPVLRHFPEPLVAVARPTGKCRRSRWRLSWKRCGHATYDMVKLKKQRGQTGQGKARPCLS